MPDRLLNFARAANGDSWHLGRRQDTGHAYVLHQANLESGGHAEEISVGQFLIRNEGHPEADRLMRLIGAWAVSALENPAPADLPEASTASLVGAASESERP